jgi:hypothetical protein
VKAVPLGQSDRAPWHEDPGAELLRLDPAALGELGTGDPGREAEVVLDPCRGRGLMRVDEAVVPALVAWTCLEHTGHSEWQGTRIIFELDVSERGSCLLRFRHEGLIPLLDCYLACESGWENFLASIAEYAETGQGSLFS